MYTLPLAHFSSSPQPLPTAPQMWAELRGRISLEAFPVGEFPSSPLLGEAAVPLGTEWAIRAPPCLTSLRTVQLYDICWIFLRTLCSNMGSGLWWLTDLFKEQYHCGLVVFGCSSHSCHGNVIWLRWSFTTWVLAIICGCTSCVTGT